MRDEENEENELMRGGGLKVKADVAGSRGMVFVARLKTNRIVGFFQKWVLRL